MNQEIEELKETYRRSLDERLEANQREVDIASWNANSRLHLARAGVLLALAMGRHLDKGALASAAAMEFAAVTWRDNGARLGVDLGEGELHEIKEAIQYVRSCRTQVGFL